MNDHPSPATRAAQLRARAQWHRTEGQNYLRHSAAAMHQHDEEARELEAEADQLTKEEHTQ
jgi:hypothetical protein